MDWHKKEEEVLATLAHNHQHTQFTQGNDCSGFIFSVFCMFSTSGEDPKKNINKVLEGSAILIT